ncbi:sortase [Chloroflexus islandicus]|uniref:Sortase n=1 Tax=Chloroflexus islandicus TaxID=1707952 RepID=A0A178MGY3_9CHLR|nr:sortase [Chloroflexus islandicus]OAN47397.1 sortase [Chloroflexus islandicus]
MRRLLILCLIALLIGLGPLPVAANTAAGTPVLFRETGHTLAYAFREFYDRQGGLPIFGYPLTEVFIEDGRPVQYFERARFEWHADLALVQVGHLGRWAAAAYADHPAFTPLPAAPANADFFPETGHSLSGAFRTFWWRNGGLPTFGYPLSEPFEISDENGQPRLVQYFERARFEWHPQNPPRYQVLLGHLGRAWLAAHPAPEWALAPVKTADAAWAAVRPTRVRVPRIGVDTAVVSAGFSFGVWDVPRYTAVHYWPISGYPGTSGNIVIAGHVGYRGIIFNQLPAIAVGDEVLVTVNGSDRRYVVREVVTVLPEDTWVLAPTSSETLTLITCVPIGVYSHRLIVRAAPVAGS